MPIPKKFWEEEAKEPAHRQIKGKLEHLAGKSSKKKDPKKSSKVSKVMTEWKEGKLHSGSKKGPKVSNRKQAVAIALSEARKAGSKIPKRRK